ncbi:MAG: hypothetical protein GEU99_16590 [Luteitalea sp.]|nr:hypothetical protein [Luteitalea sp.]
MRFEARFDTEALLVEIAGEMASVTDEGTTRLAVRSLGDHAFRVSSTLDELSPERSTVVWAVRDRDATWVCINGEALVVELQAPQSRGTRRRTSSHDALSTPMPATVVRLFVKPGDRAIKDMPLATLEAMKMELPLRAPRDGIVRRVLCREGDLVQPGPPLIELE